MAAKKRKKRVAHTEDYKRAIAERARLGKANGTETIAAIAAAEGINANNISRWLKAYPEPRRPKAPKVVPATAAPPITASRAVRDSLGLDFLAALDAYIDTRIEQGVKLAMARMFKEGIG